ncbi:hypothetical protein HGRIS_013970 [Hohenbuehelia grisea]|uniref:Uncharacterized protein n=1 Tax=Hohenbuehelia grisea TaxID=104357 RepID=A0ABR3JTZ1_9AGAR
MPFRASDCSWGRYSHILTASRSEMPPGSMGNIRRNSWYYRKFQSAFSPLDHSVDEDEDKREMRDKVEPMHAFIDIDTER